MKNRKIKAIALLLAAELIFSTFIFNVKAIDTIKWPIMDYDKREVIEYESLSVVGTVTQGKNGITFVENECYEVKVSETGYYRLDYDKDLDYYMAVSVKDGTVEKFIWLGPDSDVDDDGNPTRLLWLESGHVYYLYLPASSWFDRNKTRRVNLVFLGEIVSAELENDTFYIDGDILYDEFYDKFCDTPYFIRVNFKISFSGGYTVEGYARTVVTDSLTSGRHTLTLNVFNGHGPEFEVTLIDTGDQIDRIEVPYKEELLYAKVAEDGSVKSSYWPGAIRIYFKDGSMVEVTGTKDFDPGAEYNFFKFTQPDGTESALRAWYETDAGWRGKTLDQALDDAIKKIFDPDYEGAGDCAWFFVAIYKKDVPTLKEKSHIIKYTGVNRYGLTGTIMSYVALPVFALLRALCPVLPPLTQDALCAVVMHYYYQFIL